MTTDDDGTPTATAGAEVHGHVSDVTGGQVAVGGRVFQIDAAQGSYVVINAESDVEVHRRTPPVLRPPPAFPGLVGRVTELERIGSALDSGLSVEVHGPGGIGKTALLRAASNAPLPGSTPDGVVAIPARLGTADTLSYVFDTCYVGTRRVVPRREELSSALGDLRLLVVLDDTFLEREDIDALREALPASLLLLAGTEQRVFDGVEGVALGGLGVDEGVALIQAAVGRELTQHELDVGSRVSEVLHGTPIELVRFASLVRADDGDLVSVARGFGVDAQPEDLLVAVLRSCSVEEEAVLAALAAFDAPVGAGPVAAFSGQTDAGALLLELAQRGLVQGDDLQGWRARDRAPAAPPDRHRAAVTLATWVRERSVPEEVAGEIPAIAGALSQARRDQRWVDAVALAAAAERPLALAGRWSAWRDTLDAGLGAARADGDEASARFFTHQLAVMDDAMTEVMPVVRPEPPRPPGRHPSGRHPSGRHPSDPHPSEPHPSEPLPPPRPPQPIPDPDPIRWGRVIAAATAVLVVIGLAVVTAVFAARGGDDPDVTTASTPAPDITTTAPTDTGTPTSAPAGAPNLVAFTLADQPAELVVGRESRFTVRVQNRALRAREVGPSQAAVLTVRLSGGEAELVDGAPGCTSESSSTLRCELGPLGVGATTNVTVTILGRTEGSVTLETVARATGSAEAPTATRRFTVSNGTCSLPDVVGMEANAAADRVKEAGLVPESRTVEDGQASGVVVQQTPGAGAEVECGSTVTLLVSGLT